jgi:hypothetical protein
VVKRRDIQCATETTPALPDPWRDATRPNAGIGVTGKLWEIEDVVTMIEEWEANCGTASA